MRNLLAAYAGFPFGKSHGTAIVAPELGVPRQIARRVDGVWSAS